MSVQYSCQSLLLRKGWVCCAAKHLSIMTQAQINEAEELNIALLEMDVSDEDERHFRLLTHSMVSNNIRKRCFFGKPE